MDRMPTLRGATLLAYCGLALTSCTAVRHERAMTETPALHRQIYALGDLHLADALYYKPAGSAPDLDAYAAPLIVQELLPAGRIGRVRWVEPGRPSVEAGTPAVYYGRSQCTLDGREYQQQVFLWFYVASVEPPSGPSLPVQGVRMTLDFEGLPLIWEPLVRGQPERIIFASRRLETRAQQQHGPPLPGRMHSLETALTGGPGAIVARVLEDGPLAMGPIVHLMRDGAVGTLSCRCMPSQVDNFVETLTYDLVPFHELTDLDLHDLEGITDQHLTMLNLNSSPDFAKTRASLSELLRLPDDY